MLLHMIFDVLAWLAALTTMVLLRKTWFPASPVSETLRLGYFGSVLFGAAAGAWLLGTVNLWVWGIHEFGRSIEGALIGAIVSVELYKWRHGIRLRTGAIYALPAALGIAIGRVGCQLSDLSDRTYGIATDLAWGWDHGDGINRHPVAFYESAAMTLFAAVYSIAMLRGSATFRHQGFYVFVLFYGVERFLVEFFKPYPSLLFGLGLFQYLSLFLAGYGLAMIASNRWTPALRPSASG